LVIEASSKMLRLPVANRMQGDADFPAGRRREAATEVVDAALSRDVSAVVSDLWAT